MNCVRHSLGLAAGSCRVSLSLLIGLLALVSMPQVSQAQGLPGRRVPGGTRGETEHKCFPEAPRYFVALLPADNRSLTTAAQPTIFWYHSPTAAATAELRVGTIDAQGKRRPGSPYRVEFTPNPQGGIQHFPLPAGDPQLPPLAVGETYQWQLTLHCDPGDPERRLTIGGQIRRVAETPPAASPMLMVQQAAQAGRWVDAFSTLLSASCPELRNPAVSTGWATLLTQLGLPEIAASPQIQCQP
ncbi:DUF928 domain-containing protein [Trichothermofontia sp.]